MTPDPSLADRPPKSFAFLLRPEIYHALPPADVPPPFREPAPSTQPSLDTLLAAGRFYSAAVLVAQLLIDETHFTDHPRIFSLIYTRLATLQLLGLHDLAAQESRALQDLDSDFYRDESTHAHLAPWHLRVLAVRLQALGFGDWRRGIMSYYELAREARTAVRAGEGDERKVWRARLAEVGVRVASALVEMGDVQGALRHVRTLPTDPAHGTTTQMALLYLSLGDIASAKATLSVLPGTESSTSSILEALIQMSSGAYSDAVTSWQTLLSTTLDAPARAVVRSNLALAHLYSGDVGAARDVLEELVTDDDAPRISTFNLATVFELCADQAMPLKAGLAEEYAARARERVTRDVKTHVKYGGSQRLGSDFKM